MPFSGAWPPRSGCAAPQSKLPLSPLGQNLLFPGLSHHAEASFTPEQVAAFADGGKLAFPGGHPPRRGRAHPMASYCFRRWGKTCFSRSPATTLRPSHPQSKLPLSPLGQNLLFLGLSHHAEASFTPGQVAAFAAGGKLAFPGGHPPRRGRACSKASCFFRLRG